jgi:DNA repair ATPase RecN
VQFELFEQSMDAYRRDYGDISDDLEKIIDRIIDDMAEVQARLKDKEIELTVYLTLCQEYEQLTEDVTQRIDSIETRMQSLHDTDFRQHLDAFKVGVEPVRAFFIVLLCQGSRH